MASPSASQDATPMWDIMSPEDDKAVMEKFAAESNKIINRWFFGGASFAEKDAVVAFLVQIGAVQITIQSGSQQTTSQKQVSILFGDGEDLKTAQERSKADPGYTKDGIPSEGNSVTPASVSLDQGAEKNSEAQINVDDVDDEDNKYSVWITELDDGDDDDDQIPEPAPVVEKRSTTRPREEHSCPDCHTVLHSMWELDLHKLGCFIQTQTPHKRVYNCDQCSKSFAGQACAVNHLRKVHNMSPTKAVEKLGDLKSTKRQNRRKVSESREKRITSNKDLTKHKKKNINDPRMTSKNSKDTCEGTGHPRNEQGAKQQKQSGTKIRIGKRSLQYSDENVTQKTKRLCVRLQPLANGLIKTLESETVNVSMLTSNSLSKDPRGTEVVSNDKRAELIHTSDELQNLNSNIENDMSSPISKVEPLDIKEERETSASETLPADVTDKIGRNKNLGERVEKDTEEVNSVDVRDHDNNVTTNQKHTKFKKITAKCKFCGLPFKSSYHRNQHVLKIHIRDAQVYKCSTCNRSFIEKSIFRRHLKTHIDINDREKYNCKICEKSFLGKYNYQKHMKNHLEKPDAFECDTCGKVLTSKKGLEKHKNSKHIQKILYTCEVCGKNFYTTGNIKEHLETHTEKKTWKCDQCGAAFFRKYQLTTHMQQVHSTRQCLCKICGSAFKTPANLKQHHLTVHTDVYNFSCDICGKKFKRSTHLNAHVKIHSNDKPFKCELCNKCFRFANKLQVHMDWHNNIRSHTCDHCGKSFLTKGNLDKHRYIHTSKRPHVCRICSHGFVGLPALRKHLDIKHQITLKKRVTGGVRDERVDKGSSANHLPAHELENGPSSPLTLVSHSEDRSEVGEVS